MSRYNRALIFVLLFTCIGRNTFCQAVNVDFFYASDKKMYVLSEVDSINNNRQVINSLFIWQKERVIQIIFRYVKRTTLHSESKRWMPHSFNEFLSYALHLTLYYKPFKNLDENDYLDLYQLHGNRTNLAKFGTIYEDYSHRLKYAINHWNKYNNSLADRFGHLNVSDSPTEILINNRRRKATYANNLPLAFTLTGSDSLYFIKPYYLSIYNALPQSKPSLLPIIKEYKLITSVSFVDGSFYDLSNVNDIEQPDIVLRVQTLPYLYETDLPSDTTAMIHRLCTLNQTKFRPGGEPTSQDDVQALVRLTPVPGKTKIDTMKPAIRKLPKAFAECINSFDYCEDCYNPTISIAGRISNHCPFVVRPNKPDEAHWAYAFSKGWRHFFFNQNPAGPYILSVTNEPIANDYGMKNWQNWQLMCPGVGFWVANVVRKQTIEKKYVSHFYLNGNLIK